MDRRYQNRKCEVVKNEKPPIKAAFGILLIITIGAIVIALRYLVPYVTFILSANGLAQYGQEQFYAEDYSAYIEEVRHATGLKNIQMTIQIEYKYSDYDYNLKVLKPTCNVEFSSDEFIDYDTLKYKNLKNEVRDIIDSYQDSLVNLKKVYEVVHEYSYQNDKGTVIIRIVNEGNSIKVTSQQGAKYELRWPDDVSYYEVWYDGSFVKHETNYYKMSDANSYFLGEDRSIDAWTCALKVVRDNLKSPSSAKICKYTDATVMRVGEDEYVIHGFVDAQNSFGATIRENWTVSLFLTEEGFRDPYIEFG